MSNLLRLAVVQAEAEVTIDKAVSALGGMKRAGFAVQPHNKKHQAAYITLRDTLSRVKPHDLLNYLESQTTSVSYGAKTALEFWGVPKKNYKRVQDLPAEVHEKNALKRPDEIPSQLIVCHETHWVIDGGVTRGILGNDVLPLRAVMSRSTTGYTSNGAWMMPDEVPAIRGAPSAGGAILDGEVASGSGDAADMLAVLPPMTPRENVVKRGRTDEVEPVPASCGRELKRRRTDEVDRTARVWDDQGDIESMSSDARRAMQHCEVLTVLRNNIRAACEEGVWTHDARNVRPPQRQVPRK